MSQSELEIAACLLRTKSKILYKQTTNLRKSVEKLYQDICDVLGSKHGRTNEKQDETDCGFLVEV